MLILNFTAFYAMLQAGTNKYDVWITFFTALFSFLGMCAGIFGPWILARINKTNATVVKEELKKDNAQLKAVSESTATELQHVKRIVNGNTERLQNENAALHAEIARLNAKA
jgi:hypothetical protein